MSFYGTKGCSLLRAEALLRNSCRKSRGLSGILNLHNELHRRSEGWLAVDLYAINAYPCFLIKPHSILGCKHRLLGRRGHALKSTNSGVNLRCYSSSTFREAFGRSGIYGCSVNELISLSAGGIHFLPLFLEDQVLEDTNKNKAQSQNHDSDVRPLRSISSCWLCTAQNLKGAVLLGIGLALLFSGGFALFYGLYWIAKSIGRGITYASIGVIVSVSGGLLIFQGGWALLNGEQVA